VGGQQAALEDAVMPELLAFADTRERIRRLALELKQASVLAMCDRVRDDVLPELGVRLEDKEAGPIVKLVDREVLMRERQRELDRKEEKARQKAEQDAAKAAKAAAKLEQMRIPPRDLFSRNPEFSKFDERGVPTHDQAGEEIPKSRKKKLEKQYAAQEKDYNKVPPLARARVFCRLCFIEDPRTIVLFLSHSLPRVPFVLSRWHGSCSLTCATHPCHRSTWRYRLRG